MNWKMHHSAESYDVADSRAAAYARDLFEKQLEQGARTAANTIETVVNTVPDDAIVAGRALRFTPNEVGVSLGWNGDDHPVHTHAFGQLAQRAGIPTRFARDLATPGSDNDWRRELLAHNLNTIYHRQDDRFLTRSVGGEVRGFLSDRFRRIDSRPVLDSFIGGVNAIGAIPMSGIATDTRFALKATLPHIFEPVDNEVMTFGLELRNSDFGNGALSVRFFMNRVWCTNLCSGEDALRSIHLGKRLADDIQYSARTYELDTEANASAVRDVVAGLLSPEAINRHQDVIRTAHEKKLSWSAAKKLLGTNLQKSELEKVQESFEGNDVQMLPKGQSAWRLSNAVSWLAVNTDDNERKLDLERVAGQLVERTTK